VPNSAHEIFLSGPQVRQRYNRSDTTIWRWVADPTIGFPRPIKIKGQLFWKLSALVEFERRREAEADAKPINGARPHDTDNWGPL
jgi:predicted DNA-binding transcriptional regulator AlpA